MNSFRITRGPLTTAFHKKKLIIEKKKVEFKPELEEKKQEEKKIVELKPILTIRIDEPQNERKDESGNSAKDAMGVVMMSKETFWPVNLLSSNI